MIVQTGSTDSIGFSGINEYCLSARLIEKKIIRYTPAGVAVFDGLVFHQSVIEEANNPRHIEFELVIKALGDTALVLQAVNLGYQAHWSGFLAKRSKIAKSLVFHVLHFRSIPETSSTQALEHQPNTGE